MVPEGWILKDRSVFIEDHSVLIVSDIHFCGKSKLANDIRNRLIKLIHEFNPKKIVLNGDTFNGFPFDSYDINVLTEMSDYVSEIIILPGNHEEKIGGFTEDIKNNFTVKSEYMIDNVLIHHGHHTPTKKSDYNIIGHIHPSKDDVPVYLYGKDTYYNSSVLILPAFSKNVGNINIEDYNYNYHCPIISDGESISEYKIEYV